MRSNAAEDLRPAGARALAAYNQVLTGQADPARINEKFLEDKISELNLMDHWPGPAFWLTMARITELTLYCAGNYADSGELRAVGDLLFNPRQVLVHVRGQDQALVKDRHRPLTEQFSHMAADRAGVIEWLKKQTKLEISRPPLLPELFRNMTESGFLSDEYLADVDDRMKKIADVAGLVASCPCPPHLDFTEYLARSSPSARSYLESRLCGFNLETFHRLGLEVKVCWENHHPESSFLNKQAAA